MQKKTKIILYSFIVISLIGSLFVFSASALIGQHHYSDIFYFYKKQILGIFLGISTLICLSKIKKNIIFQLAPIFYFLSLVANVIPLLAKIGYSINGARRWIKIGFLVFQPSELLKITYILYISFLLDVYKDQKYYLFFIIFLNLSISGAILLKQSDFGTICILIGVTFIALWKFFYNKKIIIYAGIMSGMILTILIYTKAYRIKRLLTFLNPWLDPLGNGFQNIQSLVAIHNGGFFGLGIGNSIQKNFFLPMAHTDFIFSVIVEEIGLVGAGILLIKMLSFSYFFILESKKSLVIFEKYYLLSTGVLFFLQIIINTGAATALLPTKGIGFPAISYGLSSFLGISLLIGIALCFLD